MPRPRTDFSQGSAHLPEDTDEYLADRAGGGDVESLNALLDRYRRLARIKARGYFLAGGDVDDVEQEAMIGLFKAVRDFRPDRESSFRAFAELCITRQIMTAIKTAARQKHRPLNQYVSLWGLRVIDDPAESPLEGLFEHRVPDPAEELVSSEAMAAIGRLLRQLLSRFEVEVLRLYVDGCTYSEIGQLLGRHVKSIDNALQRVKRKLECHMMDAGSPDVPVAVA